MALQDTPMAQVTTQPEGTKEVKAEDEESEKKKEIEKRKGRI